ncbi:transmembrane protein 198 [Astyanax mexicanus]|uniref:transmembrane protein 198 n=1 Tax=Astyanax mexicanus TaxID=7994 RepID=UPI0020CB677D|nr:transmembrane protein 198 [Astyanax mexicanus]
MADPSMLVMEGLNSTPVTEMTDSCLLEIRTKFEVIPSVACCMCFMLGVIYCFFGYRCFKMVMFLSGLVFGTGVGYLLCLREQIQDSPLDAETRAGISLGIGLLGALVTVLVRCVGLFLTGLQLGLLLSVIALVAAGQYYPVFSPVWVPAGSVLGTSMFFAVLTLCWQKTMTIVATATLGAAIVATCMDYCVEAQMVALRAYVGLRGDQQGVMCWYSWAVVGMWPAAAALGILVQRRYTARGLSHSEVIVSGKQRQVQLMRIREKDARRRPDGTYRRRPPPLKRYAGDVLAPSYLASLRERQMSTGSSMSSLSTVHHTMIDFDYETGSMVPLTTSSSAVLRV